MLDREVALYRELRPHLRSITFVTYGKSGELDFEDRIGDIKVIFNRWRLPQRVYAYLLKNYYSRKWKTNTIFKSNQIDGAHIAIDSARNSNSRFIARCGYLHSDHMVRQFGAESREAHSATTIESYVFPEADQIVVSTPDIRDTIVTSYDVSSSKIRVTPNYVDTALFCPGSEPSPSDRSLIFIGRFTEQKNIFSLLEAVDGLDVQLTLIGAGDLEDQLRKFVDNRGLPVQFIGIVPHRQLPELLRKSSAYILTSHYEGHPKTLLEAMSCGTPVIGTDVRGIREVIHHGQTGILCGTKPEEIRKAIISLLSDLDGAAQMGVRARDQIVKQCSLDTIVQMELDTLRRVVKS